MKRTTIADLAALLHVAPSTVSRALADHPDISDAMKTRVRDVAQSMNYIPNFRARYLRAKHSRLVALIVTEMNMFFVPTLVSGLNRALQRHDYSLVVFQSDDSLVQERSLARLCMNLSIDGVLLSRSSETTDLAHLEALRAADIPTVLLDKIIETDQYSSVAIDDARASRQAVEYLVGQGHTRIVGVFGDGRQRISEERKQGFLNALKEHRIALPAGAVTNVEYLPTFDEKLDAALDAEPDATAVFVMSDELLVRTYHAVMRKGLRIPNDLSVIAISDGYAPYFLYPNITHIRHSGTEAGEKAAHILIGMMTHPSDSVIDVRIKTELVELGSVRAV